jgi:hypothetical protein
MSSAKIRVNIGCIGGKIAGRDEKAKDKDHFISVILHLSFVIYSPLNEPINDK